MLDEAVSQAVLTIHRRAGCNPAFPHIGRLVLGLFGPNGLAYGTAATLGNDHAAIVLERGGFVVHVRRGVATDDTTLPIAREVARWWAMDQRPVPIEALAAAILLPAPAVKICVETHRYTAEQIAFMFHVPVEIAEQRVRVTCSPDQSGEYPSVRLAI